MFPKGNVIPVRKKVTVPQQKKPVIHVRQVPECGVKRDDHTIYVLIVMIQTLWIKHLPKKSVTTVQIGILKMEPALCVPLMLIRMPITALVFVMTDTI